MADETGLWACVIKTKDDTEALATSNGRLVIADNVTELRELFRSLFVREVPVHRETQLPLVTPAELMAERDERVEQGGGS